MKTFNRNLKYLVRAYNQPGTVGACLEGSSRCFDKNQLIITNQGPVKISELTTSDKCLSYNHSTGKDELKQVQAINKQHTTKRCLRIKMKDGTEIICTEDHKFFYQQRYIEIKYILSLLEK